jgi:hypothetical protein
MSLEHAKIVAMMLRKQLRAFEAEYEITIGLPHQIYEGLGLTEERESWGDGGAS